MADGKNALRDAKKAMKDNDFDAVSKYCKIALKHDRKNINALLLFGRACQELGKVDDAKKSLMMAAQIEPENAVTWQGLAQLYEKHKDLATIQEINTAFSTLIRLLQSDPGKANGVYRRYAQVQLEREEKLGAADTLIALANRLPEKRHSNEVWQNVAQILTGIQDLAEEYLPKLLEALQHSLSESVLGENERNYQTYIKLLYRTRHHGRPGVVTAAQNMYRVFSGAYPLEWICRMYVEMTARPVDGEDDYPLSTEERDQYVKKLLQLNSKSPWGNLAQGLIYQMEGQLFEAKLHLRLGAEQAAKSLLGWKLLLEVQLSAGDLPGADVTCRRSLEILAENPNATIPADQDAEGYSTHLKLTQARAFVNMGHKNHLRKAVDILAKESDINLECGILLVKSRIKLLDFEKAATDLERLKGSFGDTTQLKLMGASLLASQGERPEALAQLNKLVKDDPKCAEAHLELGRLSYESGKYDVAQLSCLRAANLDSKLSHSFLYLGHVYRREGKMDRAFRCYKKAFNLVPSDDQIGAALSDIYRVRGEHDDNFRLLERVTREGGSGGGGWAWLRLGLHYLATQNPDKAIESLQYALTINPDDIAGYECLGDAYMARGAYSAALKVYTVAHTHSSSLYPLYQIAHIKQLTGELLEAIEGYEAVLKCEPEHEVRVVALVGLAEAYLASARQAAGKAMFVNLRNDCTAALKALTRAGSMEPEKMCIWKLVGDACTLLYSVPPSLMPFRVPARLISKDVSDLEEMMLLDKLEVLELGGRCYVSAGCLCKDDPGMWHDLAINLYRQGRLHQDKGDDEKATHLLERALLSLRRSLALNSAVYSSWIALGVVASCKLVVELDLAQHSFIRACELQPNAESWTHLGAFYLSNGNSNLAHEAFKQAQAFDPEYPNAWIGQALVAENIGHKETLDLFRHSTVLGVHPEGSLGYAYHISKMACDPSLQYNKHTQATIKQALPTVADCGVFYSREYEEDPIGLNISGLALEMKGLYRSAVTAYSKALSAAQKNKSQIEGLEDGLRKNLGRALASLDEAEEAMDHLAAIKSPDFFTQCILALASFKGGQFDKAYEGYTAALHWLAPDDCQKSHVLVALAALQYKFHNNQEVKDLLFQGAQLKDAASVHGLLALTAFGVVQRDEALSSAAMSLLIPHQHNKQHTSHVAFLRAAYALLLKTKERDARMVLSQTIHQHPDSAGLWRSLAHILITPSPASNPISASQRCSAAATCGGTAAKLSQAAGKTDSLSQDAVTSVLARLGVEATAKRNSKDTGGLREAQRAVLMSPGSPETWAVLIAAKIAAGHSKSSTCQLASVWAQKATPGVCSWLKNITARVGECA